MHFTEALTQMSSYAKFLKKIFLENHKIEAITLDRSVKIRNKIIPKLKDPWCFSISCHIDIMDFERELGDLEANVIKKSWI